MRLMHSSIITWQIPNNIFEAFSLKHDITFIEEKIKGVIAMGKMRIKSIGNKNSESSIT